MPLSQFKPENYSQLLADKVASVHELFDDYALPELEVFESPTEGFRLRAEFRFWHQDDDAYYVMYRKGENDTPIRIDHFPIAHERIQQLMPLVREAVIATETLKKKLFQIEFLVSLKGEALVSLIYHRKLDDNWQAAATELANTLGIKLIGRSRKQKIVLGDDYIDEALSVNGKTYHYRQIEGSFTQPNAFINQHMLAWAHKHCPASKQHDLLELYCGNGNFTSVLASQFKQVLATEISKASVKAAHYSFEQNHISNVNICRMSSEEFTQALNGEREFRRLKQQGIELSEYNFNTVLVDPPRAGLDEGTLALVSRMQRIVYISCNPATLLENLSSLSQTHNIEACALFDQFPYTSHIEMGIILQKK